MFNIKSLIDLTEATLDSAALRQGDGYGRAFFTPGDYRIKVYQNNAFEQEHNLEVTDDKNTPRQVLINISQFLKPGSPDRNTVWRVRKEGVVLWWLSADSRGVYLTGQEKVKDGDTPKTFDSRKLQQNEFYRHIFYRPGIYKIRNVEGAAEGTVEVRSAREGNRSPAEFRELAARNMKVLCTDKGFDDEKVSIMAAQAVVWFVNQTQNYRITIKPEELAK
jgi:hypothetical protein